MHKIHPLFERRITRVDNVPGFSIVYNGAIYDDGELRAELEHDGYRFFSRGDA